jgi:hypothetical protein
MSTYSYEYTYAHTISMSISERLNRLDLEIYKVGHQKYITVYRDVVSH